MHKVRHRQRPDGLLAAGKICVLETEDELADFMVEIDILSEVAHENVIKLYEAYFYQNKLWVSELCKLLGRLCPFPSKQVLSSFNRRHFGIVLGSIEVFEINERHLPGASLGIPVLPLARALPA